MINPKTVKEGWGGGGSSVNQSCLDFLRFYEGFLRFSQFIFSRGSDLPGSFFTIHKN